MAAHWGYGGHNGPEYWGNLDPAYVLCRTGRRQSPIDIAAARHDPTIGPLGADYKKTRLTLVNNGHTIQVNCEPGSRLAYGTQRYELLQFHFHSPSEHLIEGRAFGMEAHFVHRGAKGGAAVIGVLMTEGESNPALAEFWEYVPAREATVPTSLALNPAELLPQGIHFYAYEGSLTTPPCSETVQWIVMKDPIEVSRAQIDRFRSLIGENARPVQPLNDREVLEF